MVRVGSKISVTLPFLSRFHLDQRFSLLSGRDVLVVKEFFNALDLRRSETLDDIQFYSFLREATDVSDSQIYEMFEMFDVDSSGFIEFDEFYLLVCILIALKDGVEKQFLFQHARTCFELLDEDGSGTVSPQEFKKFGFMFGFSNKEVDSMFKDFDAEKKQMDYDEFQMYMIAMVDKVKEAALKGEIASEESPESSGRRCTVM